MNLSGDNLKLKALRSPICQFVWAIIIHSILFLIQFLESANNSESLKKISEQEIEKFE